MARKSAADATEGVWQLRRGKASHAGKLPRKGARDDVTYNNPYRYKIERVWWDGKIVYASEQGELEVDPKKVKVAQEYQVVYAVSLDAKGHLRGKPKQVPGQYNIYDSVPGMRRYSPIWQFNYVVVPKDYVANTLRSENDCLRSGFEIRRSQVFEN
jgi:hypothetical protein